MANSVTTQIILDGARNVVVKFEGVLDTSDYALTKIIDITTLSALGGRPNQSATKLAIDKITYNVEDGLSVNLFWEGASVDTRIEELTGRGCMKYFHFGGLPNNAASPTGSIKASTQGWAGTLSFSVIIEMHKQGTVSV